MPVAINTLNKFLRVELPGIPEPILNEGVEKAIQQFFKESESWRHTVPGLLNWTTAVTFPTLTPGTEIPTGTRLVRIDQVKYASDGTNLKPIPFETRQQLDSSYPDWEVKTGTTPVRFTHDADGTPILIPIAEADVNSSLKVRAIIAPTDALIELPDFLYYEFEDDFKNGALSRLMKIPGKDWTNLSAATAYTTLFKSGIKKAKSRANAEWGQPSRETTYGGI